MNKTISVNLVMLENGQIDQEASKKIFNDKMVSFIDLNKNEETSIAQAVTSVFDTYRGKALTIDAITTYALISLNVQPENHTTLSARITDYVRIHSKGNNPMFSLKRGKGGGFVRNSDLT